MSIVRLCLSGLCLFVVIVAAVPAHAQTVAAGPYYATPSWDQKLVCATPGNCPRFVVLSNWNSAAVLDRETGLVWERQPGVFPFELPQSWGTTFSGCFQKSTGGRKGWRMPTMEELSSLVDPSTGTLPAGHPFINVQVDLFAVYWSASRVPTAPQFAFVLGFAPGGVFGSSDVTTANHYWCVRAPAGPTF
jgi:hypothetical protein